MPFFGDGSGAFLCNGEDVSGLKGASLMAAESGPEVGGAAAEGLWDIDAACDGDVSAKVAHAAAEVDGLASFDPMRFAGGLICPANPCDLCVGGEF